MLHVHKPPVIAVAATGRDWRSALDRIEVQIAAIAAVIGAPVDGTAAPVVAALEEPAAAAPEATPAPEVAIAPALAAVETAPPPVVEATPEIPAIQPEVEAAVAEALAATDWRDEVSYTPAFGEGIEVKLVMQEGQTARFEG